MEFFRLESLALDGLPLLPQHTVLLTAAARQDPARARYTSRMGMPTRAHATAVSLPALVRGIRRLYPTLKIMKHLFKSNKLFNSDYIPTVVIRLRE